MTKPISILSVCALFFLSSCGLLEKDDEEFVSYNKSIYGKLSDKLNPSVPLAGVSVYLMQAFTNIPYRTIDSTKTNARGEFSFKFNYLETNVYKVTFSNHPNYYNDGEHRVVDEDTDTLNLSYYPLAYLNYTIKNIAPFSSTDEFSFDINSSMYINWRLFGKVDTNFTIRAPALIQNHLVFYYKSGNKDTIFSRYPTLEIGETLRDTFYY